MGDENKWLESPAFAEFKQALREGLEASKGVWAIDVKASQNGDAYLLLRAFNAYVNNGAHLLAAFDALSDEVHELRKQAGDLLAYRPGKGWASVLEERNELQKDLAELRLEHGKLVSKYRALAAMVERAAGLVEGQP